ncbi:Aste57867_22196 [Aphanomyces stellatus]|uniref:Aste57867_22196 protein n=1 Tax=Aphanomyces stellatus TaxID=120398 RepID=A0A485LPH0_9STRA|nr:hypothetical protein As57867_022127 [Aphanomyces stellatus]VFT98863.1 Aste57867_22196 [Aphanomyces stellatus]
MSLPLPENFFRCPPLAQYERQQLIDYARLVCEETIANAMAMQSAPVKKIVTNPFTKRQAIIRQGPYINDASIDAVCAYTQLTASLEAVADFFYVDSPKKMRDYADVMAQTVLDRQTLYTLVDRPLRGHKRPKGQRKDSPLHYIGIDWGVIKSELGGIVANRDACLLEVHDEFVYVDPSTKVPRRGFVRAFDSVDMACCPSLYKSHGFVRSNAKRSGHVLIETDVEGTFDFYNVLVLVPNGYAPRVLVRQSVLRTVSQVLNLEQHFQSRRLAHHVFRASSSGARPSMSMHDGKRPTSTSLTGACGRCMKLFHFFSTKTTCVKCVEPMCSSCSLKVKMDIGGGETVIVCHNCFNDGSTALHRRPLSLTASYVTTPSESSTSGFHLHSNRQRQPSSQKSKTTSLDPTVCVVEERPTVFQNGRFELCESSVSMAITDYTAATTTMTSSFSAYTDTTVMESTHRRFPATTNNFFQR